MSLAQRPPVAAVVGRPGVGKTLFALRFAEWCGSRRVVLLASQGPQAPVERQEMELANALSRLVGATPHTTRRLQRLEVTWHHGKRAARVHLVDTVGLVDGIYPDPLLRRAMAETLELIFTSDAVLHMLDGPEVARDPSRLEREEDLDAQLERYGEGHRAYAAVVNKLDLPGGREGMRAVRRRWPRRVVIGVSALEAWGFPAVRRFLARLA